MAKYKYVDTHPRLLAVDLSRQLLPGTFAHGLNHLLDHGIDLSHFDARFRNDATGAPAYPPALALKVVLFAYSQGIVSSRAIERACQEHVTFIALCGDQAPHFTTIARFVSTLGDDIAKVVASVLAVCDAEGLIGREMFAIDGVKLPSNASKHRSGTRADFDRQATKLEAAARTMLQRHRAADTDPTEPPPSTKAIKRLAQLERDAQQMRAWLSMNPEDRRGPKGTIRKSNRTDNESAKMATRKGVIQGYTGVATVDARHQIIVDAQAHGTGSEQEVLMNVITAIAPIRGPDTLITADADARTRICPAGKSLCRKGNQLIVRGRLSEHFRGAKRDCGPCALRAQCLRTPATTPVRNVAFIRERVCAKAVSYTARMKQRIDSESGRAQYAQRFATAEPVFANLRYHKGLDRFTFRSRAKVEVQWKLYCLMHNIEKLAHNGYAA